MFGRSKSAELAAIGRDVHHILQYLLKIEMERVQEEERDAKILKIVCIVTVSFLALAAIISGLAGLANSMRGKRESREKELQRRRAESRIESANQVHLSSNALPYNKRANEESTGSVSQVGGALSMTRKHIEDPAAGMVFIKTPIIATQTESMWFDVAEKDVDFCDTK